MVHRRFSHSRQTRDPVPPLVVGVLRLRARVDLGLHPVEVGHAHQVHLVRPAMRERNGRDVVARIVRSGRAARRCRGARRVLVRHHRTIPHQSHLERRGTARSIDVHGETGDLIAALGVGVAVQTLESRGDVGRCCTESDRTTHGETPVGLDVMSWRDATDGPRKSAIRRYRRY